MRALISESGTSHKEDHREKAEVVVRSYIRSYERHSWAKNGNIRGGGTQKNRWNNSCNTDTESVGIKVLDAMNRTT